MADHDRTCGWCGYGGSYLDFNPPEPISPREQKCPECVLSGDDATEVRYNDAEDDAYDDGYTRGKRAAKENPVAGSYVSGPPAFVRGYLDGVRDARR
jgi:hypothetical protein